LINKEEIPINLESNIETVRQKIDKALDKSGRDINDIKIIGVTKTVDIPTINRAVDLGIDTIGENRVQELQNKYDAIGDKVKYHMIGHLQTNKVRHIFDKVELIHSLDRISLVKELDKGCKRNHSTIDTLIQVNVSEEETKFGLKVSEVIPFIEKIMEYETIRIKGLMTMAPHTNNEKVLREVFSSMRKLKEDIEARNYQNISMDHLSMGMTNDYEIAIEEGSNMVRIGRAIFGERNY